MMTGRALLIALALALLSILTGGCTAASSARIGDKLATGALVYGACLAPCAAGCLSAVTAADTRSGPAERYFRCVAPCAITCAAASLDAHFRAQAPQKSDGAITKPTTTPIAAPPLPPPSGIPPAPVGE